VVPGSQADHLGVVETDMLVGMTEGGGGGQGVPFAFPKSLLADKAALVATIAGKPRPLTLHVRMHERERNSDKRN
jgi:hypothetical protein